MKKYLKKILEAVGIREIPYLHKRKAWQLFHKDLAEIKKQLQGQNDFQISRLYPWIYDRFEASGSASGHYFHQDLWVAMRIFDNSPQIHVDIGSRIDGFVAHVASFRTIEVLDIRPLENKLKNIQFKQADLMNPQIDLLNYSDSISCLHAIEHFGLGRYGDAIDSNGHLKGLENIYKILRKNGKFYFSTPIGPQRIEFNAHRIFSMTYLTKLFEGKYRIDRFCYVNDAGDLIEDAVLNPENIQTSFGCSYGCGIFEMSKL
jgi:SAM-dependent methyltransferase